MYYCPFQHNVVNNTNSYDDFELGFRLDSLGSTAQIKWRKNEDPREAGYEMTAKEGQFGLGGMWKRKRWRYKPK